MPSIAFDTLFKALRRGEVPPALYLHGEEDVLKEEVIRELLDRVLDPGLRDFNLDQRSAAELDPEGVETVCNTLPMMADRRVVIVRDVEAWSRRAKAKGEMLRYLEKPAPETVVVLIQGAGDPEPDAELAKRAAAVACEPLPPERARKWLLLRAAELGLVLEPEAAEHLVRATDARLSALRSELAKLSGLAAEGPISAARVGDLLGVRHGETQFDWREAVLAGEPGRAAAMLPHLLAQPGVSGVSLAGLLGTSLIGLGLARAHYDRGARGPALVSAVRSSLFRARPARLSYEAAAQEWSRLAPQWSMVRVESALRATLAADERLKTTALSSEAAILTDLVMQVALPRREVA